MDVGGEARDITRAHMLQLASQAGLQESYATGVIDEMIGLVASVATIKAIPGV